MHRPFTPGWADAFAAAINADAEYRAAASGWTWPLALVLVAAPEHGYPDDVALELDLERGTCRGHRLVTGQHATTDFVLRGPYDAWKQVVTGAMDPVVAVSLGKLKLVKGSLATLLLQTKAAKALVQCARAVPTRFPDEEPAA
jgi:putative sterol carrier protein